MSEAEQYFSAESLTARSTTSGFRFFPRHHEVHVDAGEHLGVGFRALGLKLHFASR
jgi:hypothetical protein